MWMNNVFIVFLNTNLVLYFFACVNECQNIVLLIRESICIELYYWSSDASQRRNKTETLQLGNLTSNEKQESLTYSAFLPVPHPQPSIQWFIYLAIGEIKSNVGDNKTVLQLYEFISSKMKQSLQGDIRNLQEEVLRSWHELKDNMI